MDPPLFTPAPQVRAQDAELVSLLISAGAHPLQPNVCGDSPLKVGGVGS